MPTRPRKPDNRPRHPSLAADLAVFDGSPYLVTRVVPTLYHIILLPAAMPEDALQELAEVQWRMNRLDTCLVLDANTAVHIGADGKGVAALPPKGGVVVTGKLRPAAPLPQTEELARRQRRLAAFIDDRTPKRGYLLGDLTKGGRQATAEERPRLAGTGAAGAPPGLEPCVTCEEWRGECLDPNPQLTGLVVTVHCLCANDNRCAACGEPLHERKLNANYYEPADRAVWHVPGFSGFGHDCPIRDEVPSLGYLPELLGEWDIGYPGPDGLIRDHYLEHLDLGRDGTFAWTPAPAWAPPAGRWGVFRGDDGDLRLCFEMLAGAFRCHRLVLIELPGAGWTFHWQRSRADAVVFHDRILRATRPS